MERSLMMACCCYEVILVPDLVPVIPENILDVPESKFDSPSELSSYFFFLDFWDLLSDDFLLISLPEDMSDYYFNGFYSPIGATSNNFWLVIKWDDFWPVIAPEIKKWPASWFSPFEFDFWICWLWIICFWAYSLSKLDYLTPLFV